MSGFKDATFYAQVEPVWSRWRTNGEHTVQGAKVVRLTQAKPAKQMGGTVLVKLTLRIPEAAFLPLRPEAVVVIPEDMAAVQPIEIEAVDPA